MPTQYLRPLPASSRDRRSHSLSSSPLPQPPTPTFEPYMGYSHTHSGFQPIFVDPSHPPPPPQKKRNPRIKSSNWESLKPQIRQWYIVEKRSALQVLTLLRDGEGLNATEYQLRRRLEHWGFFKQRPAIENYGACKPKGSKRRVNPDKEKPVKTPKLKQSSSSSSRTPKISQRRDSRIVKIQDAPTEVRVFDDKKPAASVSSGGIRRGSSSSGDRRGGYREKPYEGYAYTTIAPSALTLDAHGGYTTTAAAAGVGSSTGGWETAVEQARMTLGGGSGNRSHYTTSSTGGGGASVGYGYGDALGLGLGLNLSYPSTPVSSKPPGGSSYAGLGFDNDFGFDDLLNGAYGDDLGAAGYTPVITGGNHGGYSFTPRMNYDGWTGEDLYGFWAGN